jgi:hypothetical protein
LAFWAARLRCGIWSSNEGSIPARCSTWTLPFTDVAEGYQATVSSAAAMAPARRSGPSLLSVTERIWLPGFAAAYCHGQSYTAASFQPLPPRFQGEISIPNVARKSPRNANGFKGLNWLQGPATGLICYSLPG